MSDETAIGKCKISVALGAYNGAKFLPEQLESFLAQTRLPDELVVGDDCSTDETAAIVEKFAETAPFPVRLEINRKNSGSTKNFERAILRCTGNLIFLADQDDVWLPEKIERIEAEFEKNTETALVFSDAELVDESLAPLGQNLWDFTFPKEMRKAARKGKMLEVLIKQATVTGATTAFRSGFREIFAPIPTDVPNLIHDEWIALVIASQGKVAFIEEPLIKYRQHAQQQLGAMREAAQFAETEKKRSEHYKKVIRHHRKREDTLLALREKFIRLRKWKDERAKAETIRLINFYISENQQIAEHFAARQNLPKDKLKRILPIWRELATGRYGRYSKSFISAAKDFFGN